MAITPLNAERIIDFKPNEASHNSLKIRFFIQNTEGVYLHYIIRHIKRTQEIVI